MASIDKRQIKQPPPCAWAFFIPSPARFTELHGYGVETHDDLVMSLWLADLGVNWLMTKEQRKVDRRDRRQTRRREKQVRREIDGPVRRREPRAERVEDAISEAAKAEARRRLAEALERAGVGGALGIRPAKLLL